MLVNLQIVIFFVCFIVKRFKKMVIRFFALNNIVAYCTTISSNTLKKVTYYIELRIVKSQSTKVRVD